MKSKKVFWLVISIIIAICIIFIFIFMKYVVNDNEIPDGYIAVFHGGAGEITYQTYVYKINNEQGNYKFSYINTTSRTTHWGSNELIIEITKRGSVNTIHNIIDIAKENYAYSFVTLPDSDKVYTIEEYQQMYSF